MKLNDIRPGICLLSIVAVAVLAPALTPSAAEPFAAPGDMRLRHDLQLLNDAGGLPLNLTTWPLAWADVSHALAAVDETDLGAAEFAALERVRQTLRRAAGVGGPRISTTVSGADDPRIIRSFEDSPRADGLAGVGLDWSGGRFAANLRAAVVADAVDGDTLRADGSYLAARLGNWTLAAGWQDRWWGPGRDGSLILSNNARPVPAVSVQRSIAHAFETRWLSWLGPWGFTAFMGRLDDPRIIDDALLFGMRGTIRPIPALEIGISRTAQWCGEERPCGGSTFVDLLLGRDNQGVNVDSEDEPGNQLGGIDLRWRLPADIPVALYAQWIAEDTRRGGPELGSWLRQVGAEHWGSIGVLQHRSHVEVSDTSCRAGGLGFSEIMAPCAYNHSIYRTGYRYNGRAIGHGIDGNGLSYSIGSTLLQSAGHSWNVVLRYLEINRVEGSPPTHSLSLQPQKLTDVMLSHSRSTDLGELEFGLGYSRYDAGQAPTDEDGVSAFLRWRHSWALR